MYHVELSNEYNVIVQQHKNIDNNWLYDISINGTLQSRVINNDPPKEYSDVKVYAACPWHTPLTSTYGTIWGLKINDVQIGNKSSIYENNSTYQGQS